MCAGRPCKFVVEACGLPKRSSRRRSLSFAPRPPRLSSIVSPRSAKGRLSPLTVCFRRTGRIRMMLHQRELLAERWRLPVASHRQSVMRCVRVDVACAVRILGLRREFARARPIRRSFRVLFRASGPAFPLARNRTRNERPHTPSALARLRVYCAKRPWRRKCPT